MPTGRIKAPRCNCRDAVIIAPDPRFDLRGILQADHGRDKRVGQFCCRTKAARQRRDDFRTCHCSFGRALHWSTGRWGGSEKSNRFLMFDQTFEARLCAIEHEWSLPMVIFFKRLLKDASGVTAIEYGLISALIVVGSLIAIE